ncbi:MAG: KAP family NTPase [Clostridium sp.]|nr:KAP family NTPase [Bacteroides sp.]MCM1198552.1 KAP family NTPase [Clostridium sp.]
MILDEPITSAKDDLLDYHSDVKQLYKTIKELTTDSSHSIGIISPWGSGKTSYMNMVKELMKNDRFIIVDFNPRHSKEVKFIQEDFFKKLCLQLKIYNGELSTLIEDYLDVLNIVDKKGLVSWLKLYNKLTDRTDQKERLQVAINRLNRRIVVFIEDFDRLLDVEVVEVFKLIDENASLGNIIFISAYDKEHLQKLLGSKYDNEEANFSDKFFSQEVYLPRRPYSIILDFISQKLKERLSWYESDCESNKAWLRNNRDMLQKYIPTFRDAKRFLNLFLRDYSLIKNEVVFSDYFLVSLIKYKYPKEYNALYEKKYLKRRSIGLSVFQIINGCDAKSSDIIKTLFPTYDNTLMMGTPKDYKSIRLETSFHKYFENYVHGILSVKQMEDVLNPGINNTDVEQILADWNADNAIQDLLNYLDFKDLFSHGSKSCFERYVDILFWITSYVNPYKYIASLIEKTHINELIRVYEYENEAEYKQFIDSKFRGSDYSYITRQLILDCFSADNLLKFIFSKEEMLEWSKSYLNKYIETGNAELNTYKNLLYSCIADVNKDTRKATLDAKSCDKIKRLIYRHPCSYLDGFVFLGGVSSSPDFNSIACEPFWKQIFGSADNFEDFISNSTLNACDKINLVRNFWRLYKRNDYEQIFYEGMGNVQEKIDNDLRDEVGKLDKLEAIDRKYEEVKSAFDAAPEREAIYRDKLKELSSEIKGLHIPIKYRVLVYNKIVQSLNQCHRN